MSHGLEVLGSKTADKLGNINSARQGEQTLVMPPKDRTAQHNRESQLLLAALAPAFLSCSGCDFAT